MFYLARLRDTVIFRRVQRRRSGLLTISSCVSFVDFLEFSLAFY